MEEMLIQINFLYWLTGGFFLLMLELMAGTGYFLWLGLMALLAGITFSVNNVPWNIQWLVFAGFTLICLILCYQQRQLKQVTSRYPPATDYDAAARLIGYTIQLDENVLPGEFQMTLMGHVWTARTRSPILAGTIVTVQRVDGITLIVSA